MKILGIWFKNDNSDEAMYNRNFKHMLARIRYICGTWSNRTLSLKGKVTVINALLASLLQYPTAVLYIPPRVITEYRKIVSIFLWNNKTPKIAYKFLTLPIHRGGLKLMDLESRITVNLLQWVRRLLRNPTSNAASTLRTIIHTDSLQDYFASERGCKLDWTKEHKFYASVMKIWDRHHGFEPSDDREVRREILWQNKHILNGGFPIKGGEWNRAGIGIFQASAMGILVGSYPTRNYLPGTTYPAPSWTF